MAEMGRYASGGRAMSASLQKQTSERLLRYVRFVPLAAVSRCSKTERLFDHVVGSHEQARRHGQSERLRRFEVHSGLKLGRRLHRKVGWPVAAQDAIGIK